MSAEVATQKGTCDEKARPSSLGAKLVSYGLPCAHCRVYHFAHFATCPICGCGERISPNRHDGDAARVRSSNGRVGEHDSDELVNKSQMLARGFVVGPFKATRLPAARWMDKSELVKERGRGWICWRTRRVRSRRPSLSASEIR